MAFRSIWIVLLALAMPAPAADAVVIHEWGTFTALQDEAGQPIGGINTDDEPLPSFAHDIAAMLLIHPTQLPPLLFQGAPSCHRDVTMRLETPVLYFHPPTTTSFTAEVSVAFVGGWLTQFYPDAKYEAPGLDSRGDFFGALSANTRGSLTWSGLTIGGDAVGPKTDAHVWLAPRQAQAAAITTAAGEHEKFLFYRGVAHLDAPLSVVRNADQLEIHSHLDATDPPLVISHAWLADIRADGRAAFRELPGMTLGTDRTAVLTTTAAGFGFAVGDYGDGKHLRTAMRAALIADGLFADEAQAQLDTWEVSYFTSSGLRLFFLLPQSWTDRVLPLSVSLSGGTPTRITRTMVGRIELVAPVQRRLLKIIAAGPASDPTWLRTFLFGDGQPKPNDRQWAKDYEERWRIANSDHGDLAKAGAVIPADYHAYLELGRFRNALLLDEQRLRPQPALAQFIANYGLEAYSPRK